MLQDRLWSVWIATVLLLGPCALIAWALAQVDELAVQPDWQIPGVAVVRRDALEWLASTPLDEATRAQAQALWMMAEDTATAQQRLERLATTFALARADVRRLDQHCAQRAARPAMVPFGFLTDPQSAALLRLNMRLIYGRWLAQHELFDEAESVIGDLKPADVVDPATLLFYQSVVHYRLIHLVECRQALAALLQREDELPRRYRYVAERMQRDLMGVKEDSLDHIARRMDDIKRRLQLGRANQKVRQIEDGVVASLDKLIDKLESEAQQRQARAAGGGSLPANSPAPDSRILTGKGPGKVDRRQLGQLSDWGNLPPKRREEAIQQIGQRFPSHYREVIQQYFKRLAREQPAE